MRKFIGLIAVIVLSMTTSVGWAVLGTEVDTFQDGTTEGWTGGASPVNVPNGGPTGAGDRYLQLTSLTSNMASYNTLQWSGDYASAGIADIGVDLFDGVGQSPASMRLVIFGPTGSRWTSNNAFVVPSDGLWHHTTFSMREADLTNVVVTTDTYAQTIAAAERLMLRHDDGVPTAGGTAFSGSIGIDNITAVSVPEPASLALFAAAGLILRRRR